MRIFTIGETTYDILFRDGRPVGACSGGSAYNSAISESFLPQQYADHQRIISLKRRLKGFIPIKFKKYSAEKQAFGKLFVPYGVIQDH